MKLFSVFGNPADERVILFCHCEIHVAGVRNVEVRPAINTDTDPNPNRIPNRKLSLLEMAENNITRSSAGLPKCEYGSLLLESAVVYTMVVYILNEARGQGRL